MSDNPQDGLSAIKVSKLPDGYDINVDKWLMKEHIEWTVAAKAGDPVVLNKLMASAINKWPFKKLSPAELDDYEKLTPKEWTQVIKAMQIEVNNAFLE